MKILLINKYFYIKGGAENSFFQMAKLLEKKGHEVVFFAMESPRNFESPYSRYFISHVDYDNHSLPNILKCSGRMLYSWEARRGLEELIAQEKPDIAHLNNIYHQISPSIIHSLKKYRVPMVMSLRDYKLVCASYSMVHQGVVCEACKDGRYYHAFSKKCVKGSLMKSLLNTSEMYLHHKMLNIYDDVDMFISPSRFLKSKVNEMGFKKEIKHLFNFVNLDEFNPEFHWSQRTAVFFGRLSHEKGVA
ncbi:MAG: glycosyltransferase, partial [Candidatus Omnitrophica bacterium]|nr:glycosyltransferase [Candidatus Omnitrophota bacterium]